MKKKIILFFTPLVIPFTQTYEDDNFNHSTFYPVWFNILKVSIGMKINQIWKAPNYSWMLLEVLLLFLKYVLIKVRNDVTNQQVKNAVSYGVRVKFCLLL